MVFVIGSLRRLIHTCTRSLGDVQSGAGVVGLRKSLDFLQGLLMSYIVARVLAVTSIFRQEVNRWKEHKK